MRAINGLIMCDVRLFVDVVKRQRMVSLGRGNLIRES